MSKLLWAVTVFLSTLLVGQAFAADHVYNSYRDKGAVRGYDVVAYFSLEAGDKAVKGKPEFATVWNGVPWYFSSAANLEKFTANPEAYAPQFGGYCAFAAGQNFTTSIRPNSWTIHKGKLYLNHNSSSARIFRKDLDTSIALAEANWPSVLERCERRDNCRKAPKIPDNLKALAELDELRQKQAAAVTPELEISAAETPQPEHQARAPSPNTK